MCRDVFTIWLGRSREMWRLRGSRGTPFSHSSGHTAWQEQTHLDRLEFLPDHGSIFIKAKFVYQPCLRSHHLLKAFEKPAWNELHPHSSCWNSLTLPITRGGPQEITVWPSQWVHPLLNQQWVWACQLHASNPLPKWELALLKAQPWVWDAGPEVSSKGNYSVTHRMTSTVTSPAKTSHPNPTPNILPLIKG